MSPFDFVRSINQGKDIVRGSDYPEQTIEEYNPFLTNRALSYHIDAIFSVNEINLNNGIDKQLQYDFYLKALRPAKRFATWAKKGNSEDLETIKEYYKVSYQKAAVIRSLLTSEQIGVIRTELIKGGN